MSPSVKTIVVDAILFDMDGTLIDSTPGLKAAWTAFSDEYGLGDSNRILNETHGRRLADTLREYCHITDESKLEEAIVRFEALVIKGVSVLPGVPALLSQLSSETAFGWTIVTSASKDYAPQALASCGILLPRAGIVTANDVSQGKPHAAPYLAGAGKCGVDPTKCLVVEDAIAGMQSGKAAGALVLAVCTSTSRQKIVDSFNKPSDGKDNPLGPGPDFIATDLSKMSARWTDGKVEVTIDEA